MAHLKILVKLLLNFLDIG